MAKSEQFAEAPAQQAPVEAPARTTLEEFCTLLSKSDRRVEMIGAFAFMERRAKRTQDTAAAYQQRYEAFCKAPA